MGENALDSTVMMMLDWYVLTKGDLRQEEDVRVASLKSRCVSRDESVELVCQLVQRALHFDFGTCRNRPRDVCFSARTMMQSSNFSMPRAVHFMATVYQVQPRP